MKYTDELSRIAEEHGGTLFPRDVVNAARDPNSILHGAFDWNDTVAAEKWRLEQARRLIRVQVVQLPNRNTPIQAFVSLSTSRTDEGGYMPIRTVMGDARMLTVAELAAATGFPAGYHFAGGDTAAKKQIGNAVCPDLARALYLAALTA